jgi:hypothetical protein
MVSGEASDERSIAEAEMLSKSRCPHTGVVNFFTHADPLLAVGSVAEEGDTAVYVWRCYVGEEACGLESDMSSAEARLRSALAGSRGERRAKKMSKTAALAHSTQTPGYWRKLNEAAAAVSRRGSTR